MVYGESKGSHTKPIRIMSQVPESVFEVFEKDEHTDVCVIHSRAPIGMNRELIRKLENTKGVAFACQNQNNRYSIEATRARMFNVDEFLIELKTSFNQYFENL